MEAFKEKDRKSPGWDKAFILRRQRKLRELGLLS